MEVECSFRYSYSGFRYNRMLYVCVVSKARIVAPKTKIEGFSGLHLPGKNNNGVEGIEFVNTTVEYSPRGLSKIFPNLKRLTINRCGLKEIYRDDLLGLENLEKLEVINNELSWLPTNLFTGFSKLKRIDFSHNKLETLSSKILDAFVPGQLTYLSFYNNPKINSFIDIARPSQSVTLEQLRNTIDRNCGKPDEIEICNELLDKQEFCHRFVNGIKDLWESKQLSDFTVTADLNSKKKEFNVHKNVLASQSSVLATIFGSDMKEKKTGVMHIEDFEAPVVDDFFRFLYTGEFDEPNAMDLFAIAAKYEVDLLRERAGKVILKNIDQTNAIDVFCLAYLYESEQLKLAAFNKIKESFPQKEFDDALMEEPETLKKVVKAVKKIQEVQAEVEALLGEVSLKKISDS